MVAPLPIEEELKAAPMHLAKFAWWATTASISPRLITLSESKIDELKSPGVFDRAQVDHGNPRSWAK